MAGEVIGQRVPGLGSITEMHGHGELFQIQHPVLIHIGQVPDDPDTGAAKPTSEHGMVRGVA